MQDIAVKETNVVGGVGKKADVFQIYKNERNLARILRKECVDVLISKDRIKELANKIKSDTDLLRKESKALDYFFYKDVRDPFWRPSLIDGVLYKDIDYNRIKLRGFGLEAIFVVSKENEELASKLLIDMDNSRDNAVKSKLGECEFNLSNGGE